LAAAIDPQHLARDKCAEGACGSEGGTEAMEGYFNTKFITQTGV
jgi:hypothetical protein